MFLNIEYLFCGDTPFYAFENEIKDFFLTRKKTGRRYGSACNIIHYNKFYRDKSHIHTT